MNRLLTLAIATLFLWTPGQLWAGVFARDWKTPGDGLLTYDDVNQREWLDLSQTLLNHFPGNSAQLQYHSVLSELGPGGIFEGFGQGVLADAVGLANSAGIDTSTLIFATNDAPTRTLIDLLSSTATFPGDKHFAQFILDDLSAAGLRGQFFTNPSSGLNGMAGFAWSNSLDDVGPRGVMVFRLAVPEPSTIAITVLIAFFAGVECRLKLGR